jgi:glycosyltransferase involved in cell wall biosynthesis
VNRRLERGAPLLVSVVVPVRNAVRTLPDQLAALDAQDHRGDWEAIVADNGSSDGSLELAERWAAARPHARVVAATARRGAAHARNIGAAIAPHADVVAGRLDVDTLNPDVVRSWNDPPAANRLEEFNGFLMLVAGSNTGIWRDAFERLGGFDDSTRCGEDVCLGWRAQLRSMELEFAPEAVVRQRYRAGLGSAFRQYFKYGQGDAWLYSRYAGSGMPPSPLGEVTARWRRLAAEAPGAVTRPHRRGRWVQTAALACGRIAGSARNRVLYL